MSDTFEETGITEACMDGKHWRCEDPIDCECPCHEGDEEDWADEASTERSAAAIWRDD